MSFEGYKRHKGCETAHGEKRYSALKWVGENIKCRKMKVSQNLQYIYY